MSGRIVEYDVKVLHDRIIVDMCAVRFVDRGGEYIDIGRTAGYQAEDVINVWDYEAGKRRIPFTVAAVTAAAKRYLNGG